MVIDDIPMTGGLFDLAFFSARGLRVKVAPGRMEQTRREIRSGGFPFRRIQVLPPTSVRTQYWQKNNNKSSMESSGKLLVARSDNGMEILRMFSSEGLHEML